jgi:hypothetical protein
LDRPNVAIFYRRLEHAEEYETEGKNYGSQEDVVPSISQHEQWLIARLGLNFTLIAHVLAETSFLRSVGLEEFHDFTAMLLEISH